jgi:hypothetical protein
VEQLPPPPGSVGLIPFRGGARGAFHTGTPHAGGIPPSVVLELMSRALMARTRTSSSCLQPAPTGHCSPCPVSFLSVVRRTRGPVASHVVLELSTLALPMLALSQLWSWSWCLGPGCSESEPALHVGSLALLVTACLVLSPPRRVACARTCGARRDVLELSQLALLLLELSQLWPGPGAGVSGPDAPDQDLLFTSAAWPAWSRLAESCPLLVVRRAAATSAEETG